MCARKIVIVITLSLLIAVLPLFAIDDSNPTTMSNIGVNNSSTNKIIIGVPEFINSEAQDDYVNAVTTKTYGDHTNYPPDGMGQDNGGTIGDRTTLTEVQYTGSNWSEKLRQDIFTGTPSDWYISNPGITYGGGYFRDDSSFGFGWIYCKNIDLSAANCAEVRFSLNIAGEWVGEMGVVSVYFWDSNDWQKIAELVDGEEEVQTISSTSSAYFVSDFKVRVEYGFGGEEWFRANNWVIEARYTYQYHAFQSVYRFDNVVHDEYTIENLVVDFADGSSSTENIEFRFAAGDTTPDNLVYTSNGEDDFVVSVTDYLTGPTCYIEIRDTNRSSSDSTADVWKIDRLYLHLDIPSPAWVILGENQFLEFPQEFQYVLEASTPAGLGLWWLNDTTYFSINQFGQITNSTLLQVGSYGLQVFVNDTWGRTIDSTFTVIVQDTIDPIWIVSPENQLVEYGEFFVYSLSAYDAAGIGSWILNETDHFSIDSEGTIRNNTLLEERIFAVNVTVADMNGNAISESFKVNVSDTITPEWVVMPENQTLEYGYTFVYPLSASDIAGLHTWWISDGTNFRIDNKGVIENNTILAVNTYGLHIYLNDTHGNILTGFIEIIVNDTIPPEWITYPENKTIEFGNMFQYQLQVYDLAAPLGWWMNDTVNFQIDSNGFISSKTVLNVGNYTIQINVTDQHGLHASVIIIIEVDDTTNPEWTMIPEIQELEFGEQLALQLYATDLSEIGQWSVNDTTRFQITNEGFLTSLGNLASGWYYIKVTVMDTQGNPSSIVVKIFVKLPTTITATTEPPSPLLLILAISGIGIGTVVLFASVRTWRTVRLERIKQLEESKGDVDKALEYLDSIKPNKKDESGEI